MQQTEKSKEGQLDRWAFRLVCASVFTVAFSLPMGRALLALGFIVLLVDLIRGRRFLRFPPVGWCWVAFVAVAMTASAFGVDPGRSFQKLDKRIETNLN